MNGTKYLNITLTVNVRCRLSADLFPAVYLTQDWRCWTFKLSLLQTGTYYRAARRQSGGGVMFQLCAFFSLHPTSYLPDGQAELHQKYIKGSTLYWAGKIGSTHSLTPP